MRNDNLATYVTLSENFFIDDVCNGGKLIAALIVTETIAIMHYCHCCSLITVVHRVIDETSYD